jgi:acetyl-CoA carboxylase carboxyl transferase subunit beta
VTCPRCERPTDAVGWCEACGRGARIDAATWLGWLVEHGDDPAAPADRPDPLGWPGYDAAREAAARATGADESVLVRVGRLRGTTLRAVVVAWEFGFLGGSMGSVAGQRIAAAYDLAREHGLPVVLLPATGGARMQEGMASLVQMAATTAAAQAHRTAGLLQVGVVRDPTTGGVFASHANLADVVLAEVGATVGFAGPRVSAAMTGGRLPVGSHTAEGARAAGLVDAVVRRPDLPDLLARLLGWGGAATRAVADRPAWVTDVLPAAATLTAPPEGAGPRPVTTAAATGGSATDAWDEVLAARAPDRPRTPAVLAHPDVRVAGRLRGDRAGAVDPAIDVALVHWAGQPAVVVGMDPGGGAVNAAGYRTAWRGLDLAARLGVPVVTLVDTPGADATAAGEAGGVAHHVAETLRRVLSVETPVVAVVLGEGGSGGALALATGDRLLVQEHAVFSVIAPEGAAAILHRDTRRAAEVARQLDPTAARAAALGIADEVLPEPHEAPLDVVVAAVARHLEALRDVDPGRLAAARMERWRHPLR